MKNTIKPGLILTALWRVCYGLPPVPVLIRGLPSSWSRWTRGDITISVSGSGKIEASHEARLTFGSAGKVDKILVKEGDEVKKGDVLARLDTSALELALAQSQVAVTQAEVALTQAQLAQKTAEYNLKNTRDTEDALKLALLNAQIAWTRHRVIWMPVLPPSIMMRQKLN